MIDRMGLKQILFGGAGLGVWEGRNEVLPTASVEAGMNRFMLDFGIVCFAFIGGEWCSKWRELEGAELGLVHVIKVT
jgi:hypothetical protein